MIPVRTASNPRTEHTPAEEYPASKPSQEQSDNTGASLNDHSPLVTLTGVSNGLAQTGVTTSLLLNSSHFLLPTAV